MKNVYHDLIKASIWRNDVPEHCEILKEVQLSGGNSIQIRSSDSELCMAASKRFIPEICLCNLPTTNRLFNQSENSYGFHKKWHWSCSDRKLQQDTREKIRHVKVFLSGQDRLTFLHSSDLNLTVLSSLIGSHSNEYNNAHSLKQCMSTTLDKSQNLPVSQSPELLDNSTKGAKLEKMNPSWCRSAGRTWPQPLAPRHDCHVITVSPLFLCKWAHWCGSREAGVLCGAPSLEEPDNEL